MSLAEYIRSIFSREEEGWKVEVSQHGMLFHSDKHALCRKGDAPARLQNQYIFLQMLAESGEAEDSGVFVLDSEKACALTEGERELLGLPGPWPGTFEIFTRGHTFKIGGFHPELRLVSSDGRKTEKWSLEGPYLRVGGQEYLPTAAQYLALSAISKHASLSPEKQTEAANLAVIYALQKAKSAGVDMDLRQFDRLHVDEAERIGVTAFEEKDGGLRLVPDFGLDISPDEVEKRLRQLEGDEAVCLRVGDRVVMLDEQKLLGIREILNNRKIPARDRENFLKAPAAFLDAYLVELDNGFSIRVHGEELFRKAYFGETDARRSSWFGSDEQVAILLESAGPLISNEEELEIFTNEVRQAGNEQRPSIPLGDVCVLIPEEKERLERDLETVARTARKQWAKNGIQKPQTEAITVALELNDDEEFGQKQNEYLSEFYWRGELKNDAMTFTPFSYQEDGIRWLVGHAMHAVEQEEEVFEGALLADDMGLGKTFMTLAGLNAWQNIQRDRGQKIIKPTLVVAPVVLLENWKAEIARVFPQSPFSSVIILQSEGALKTYRIEGVTGDRAERHALKVGREFGSSRLDQPGALVLTNYETLRRFPFSLGSVDWGMIIFDEAQAVKNPNSLSSRAAKGLKADFRLAVTGTPVENSLIDFWNIFDTVHPGVLGTCQGFRREYIQPILQSRKNDFGDEEDGSESIRRSCGERLRQKVGHFMLRRIKEDKLSNALPKKNVFVGGNEQGRVAWLAPVMTGDQKLAYDAVLSKVAAAKIAGNLMEILLPSLKDLRDISLHPELASSTELHYPKSRKEAENFLAKSAKLMAMMKILEDVKAREEKVILFVINRELQYALAASLNMIFGLGHISVVNGEVSAVAKGRAGSSSTRKGIIEAFEQREGFNIIIMSPLAAGVGLTVVGANNVIHLERHWNPAKEAQASDRVYRIGQTRDVNIYIPILEHPELVSFDRTLDRLLQYKTDLKDAVVTPGEVKPADFDLAGMLGV